ncbi:hypothetical protein LOK49_LG07G01626 [Camellia lanceoleosa]|uniref:Uncharacterized protein n=1 Tax=Camellia lanceoleosa TaxID=1840588 RepID=A0ACC0H474_9ERIC|nr:hypothetical protein LOK49_LG07G01626 [Camellia lanceoleosa]
MLPSLSLPRLRPRPRRRHCQTRRHAPLRFGKQRSLPHRLPSFARSIRASSNLQGGYRGPKSRREWVADWLSRNDDVVRSFPIYVGGISLLAVLFNRSLSGIALVFDAALQLISSDGETETTRLRLSNGWNYRRE